MSSSIAKDSLMHVLPAPLSNDKEMRNLAETAASALAALWEKADLPLIYTQIDSLPEELLDILARDFQISWYDYDASIDTKRTVFRDSFYVRRHLGTPAAVQRAISDVYGAGFIQEWFQYGGEPYHFRVYTTNLSVLQQNREKFMRLLDRVKNVRSILENVYYYGESSAAKLHIATRCTGVSISTSAVAKLYPKEG